MRSKIWGVIGCILLSSTLVCSADNWHFECADPGSPGAREGARMVYDSLNDRLILFGRYQYWASFYSSADLWSWTPSSGWFMEHLSDAPSMSRRGWGSFSFDAARNTVVWYGGMTGLEEHHQTWTWNGSSWTLQNPASAPPDSDPSFAFPMAYDSVRNVCVLVAEDTIWEWDGATWSQILTTVLPGAGSGSAMAYDSQRQRMVLFASDYSNPNSKTLEYNGTDWELKSPATVILEHSYSTMFYDSVRQDIIMFGGFYNSGTSYVCNDTYRWDGTDWTLLTPAQSPPPGADYSSAFHPGLGTGFVINGIQSSQTAYSFESGMWSWDGTTWSAISAGDRPSPRHDSAMAWDSDRQRIVLFGGAIGPVSTFLADTWEFDGVNWSQMAPTTQPPPSTETELADMIYHRDAGVTFLVTGTNPIQTWTWDGSDWSQLTTSAVPGDGYPLIACDGPADRMLLVSGDETFLWSGTDWTMVTGSGTPASSGFNRYDLTFDEGLSRFVMLVAQSSPGYSDTWLFDTDIWVNSGLTVPLDEPRLAWDAVTGRTVAVGGYEGITLNEAIWMFDGTGWMGSSTVYLGGPEGRWRPSLCAHGTGLYYFAGRNDGIDFNELWNIEWQKAVPVFDGFGLLILVAALSLQMMRKLK